ncbi:site-specific integrase [Specibacter sp. NPDC078692]|uniref:site-specific integrase n=1 Tax=Specibacter sp. NPDC078692 TaxID=3155818 RepID=UPI00342DA4A4
MGTPASRTWFLYFVQELPKSENDDLLLRALSSLNGTRLDSGRIGKPFLLDQHGAPHSAFNAFFASGRMRNRAPSTNRKYAHALRVWMNFLELRTISWETVTDDDLFDYKFWRRTDPNNPRPVSGSTWGGDLAAISAFHDWAARTRGITTILATTDHQGRGSHYANPGMPRTDYASTRDRRVIASTVRSADVKWFSPGAFRKWRDVGLHGIAPNGQERTRWRPRSQTRDAAFVDGLYGTGLRLQEWASVLTCELRQPAEQNRYVTLQLAAGCAKGGHGHSYWVKREVINSVNDYIETDRAAAIRRAQASQVYDQLTGIRIVTRVGGGGRLELTEPDGTSLPVKVNNLSPQQRALLFTRTNGKLEPLALWLHENGLPRPKRSWYKSFARANARVEKAGIDRLQCHPHMLRHSFALRWYAVGRLIWERRSSHLDAHQTLDFREQFGDTWSLVQTMLGHADVNTTKKIYLEPFRSLDVKLLLEHGTSELQADAFLHILRSNPRVRLDDDALIEGQL